MSPPPTPDKTTLSPGFPAPGLVRIVESLLLPRRCSDFVLVERCFMREG